MFTLLRRGLTLRRVRLALLCFSVCANAICAGGIFCFPIISSALVTHLKLTQPQLTTVAIAGIIGQYPFAAFIGKILDRYGAWMCSLISACFYLAGFGLFANEISKLPDNIDQSSASTVRNLVAFFFLAGLGTLCSHFSSTFAASKNFPNYIGVAVGASSAFFGLSPTFLSFIAFRYFSSSDGQVDVTHFLQFLAILCGCVHLIGGFTMHIVPSPSVEETKLVVTESDPEVPNERTTLLPQKSNGHTNESDQVQVDVVPISDESLELKSSSLDLLSDRKFWVLAFITFINLGSCEMVVSNIGSIVLSLPSQAISPALVDPSSPAAVAAAQVRILSIFNTLSRLLLGLLADIISPVPSRTVNRNRGFIAKHRISRTVFLAFPATLLFCTYIWMVIGVREQASIWALSIGAGVAYGCTFTVLPSLLSSIWGLSNLARNYGITMYATFLGTPTFSYLYAFVSDAHVADPDAGANPDGLCHGPSCWTLTFQVSAVGAALALGASLYLWRAWKGRV